MPGEIARRLFGRLDVFTHASAVRLCDDICANFASLFGELFGRTGFYFVRASGDMPLVFHMLLFAPRHVIGFLMLLEISHDGGDSYHTNAPCFLISVATLQPSAMGHVYHCYPLLAHPYNMAIYRVAFVCDLVCLSERQWLMYNVPINHCAEKPMSLFGTYQLLWLFHGRPVVSIRAVTNISKYVQTLNFACVIHVRDHDDNAHTESLCWWP